MSFSSKHCNTRGCLWQPLSFRKRRIGGIYENKEKVIGFDFPLFAFPVYDSHCSFGNTDWMFYGSLRRSRDSPGGNFQFLFGDTWNTSVSPEQYGILPFLLSSVMAMGATVIVAVPASVLVAIGMAHFLPRPVAAVLRTIISMLAGIPSVIYGFVGMVVLVPFVQEVFSLPAGLTLLSAVLVLIVMTLPTIISVSESSITAVAPEYMQASLALGVDKEYTLLHIVVPAAKSGILAGILLGLGRAVGETMAVIMVAGNVPDMPEFLKPVRFLTTAIVTEMAYATEETSQVLMGIGLVLFVFIVIINGIFYGLIRTSARQKG